MATMSAKKETLKDEAMRLGKQAKAAARRLAALSPEDKNRALELMADKLEAQSEQLLDENNKDLEAAKSAGVSSSLLDRIALNPGRVRAMAKGLRDIGALPDPVHEIVKMWRRPNGLQVGRMRIPLGVIGIIYESRPNVTADAAALCVKAGNAVILRGGSEAIHSNTALARLLAAAGERAGLPADSIQLIESTDREAARTLMRAEGLVDVLIPRGGESLKKTVLENATVPVLTSLGGNCH